MNLNAVDSRRFNNLIYIEPGGYDLDQIGTLPSRHDLPMLNFDDNVQLERWFEGPVQMSLRTALVSFISTINFYAAKGLSTMVIDFDNQPLLWMSQMKTKEEKTFLEICISILCDQNQINYDGKSKIQLKEVVKL